MDFFVAPGPVPMPDLKPGDVVHISVADGDDFATYSGLVSTVGPGLEPDEMMHVTFWTEPSIDNPA